MIVVQSTIVAPSCAASDGDVTPHKPKAIPTAARQSEARSEPDMAFKGSSLAGRLSVTRPG
jgi:hypothetical protein